MRNKYTLFLAFSLLTSVLSFGQTVKEKIEAQAKDPKRAENAAKADVYITKDKSIVAEDTGTYGTPKSAVKSKTAATKAKKRKCKKG